VKGRCRIEVGSRQLRGCIHCIRELPSPALSESRDQIFFFFFSFFFLGFHASRVRVILRSDIIVRFVSFARLSFHCHPRHPSSQVIHPSSESSRCVVPCIHSSSHHRRRCYHHSYSSRIYSTPTLPSSPLLLPSLPFPSSSPHPHQPP
jgi:hypothetical protein